MCSVFLHAELCRNPSQTDQDTDVSSAAAEGGRMSAGSAKRGRPASLERDDINTRKSGAIHQSIYLYLPLSLSIYICIYVHVHTLYKRDIVSNKNHSKTSISSFLDMDFRFWTFPAGFGGKFHVESEFDVRNSHIRHPGAKN